jgi:hypothetical protein
MDLYQEVLYELWESLDRFEGRSDPITPTKTIGIDGSFFVQIHFNKTGSNAEIAFAC